SPQLIGNHLRFAVDDLGDAGEELLCRWPAPARAGANGEGQHCLAKHLAWDGTRINAHSADDLPSLDDCRALAQLGSLHGAALTRCRYTANRSRRIRPCGVPRLPL